MQESICTYLEIYKKQKLETHSNSLKSWEIMRRKGGKQRWMLQWGEEWEGREVERTEN